MKIEMFFKEQFGRVRTITEDEVVWFLAKDIAKALGYKNDRDAIRTHTSESDRKTLSLRDCRESRQSNLRLLWENEMDKKDKVFINESGLYCLIFGSKLPSAEDFKSWVTSTVLPSIRRNGGYIEGQEDLSKEDLEKLIFQIQNLTAKVEKLQARRHELIKERDTAKTKLRGTKQEIKALNEYAGIFEGLYFDLLGDYKILKSKLTKLTGSGKTVDIPERKLIRVDAEGFLI